MEDRNKEITMNKQLIVAQDGSGDFTTVQAAIDGVKCVQNEYTTIQIKAGIYKEVIHIRENQDFIQLVGDGTDKTIITFNNNAGKLNQEGIKIGTNNSATVFIDGDYIRAEGITFENSYYQPGLDASGRQAVAVNTTGQQIIFKQCAFKGYQDTLYAREGACYFYECYIEGDIDFIFGGARAVFENCQIHSLYGGSQVDNGYVTAASTKASQPYGFLFENCKLTADFAMPDHTVYLGRPWHPSARTEPVCTSTVFKNCQLGTHIKEEGWTFMGEVQPETERLYEFNNTGEGAVLNIKRRQLTEEEAKNYTKEKILEGFVELDS